MSKVNVQTIFGQLDDAQVKTLKDGIGEMCVFLSNIDNEKQKLKDVLDSVFEETKIPKKIINKLAKVRHKQNFVEETTEFNEFESLYEVVMKESK